MKLTGMMTTKNIGIAVKITTTVPRTLVDMLNKSLMFIGIWVSTMSTSLENLFRILPRGVVSKKDIGDLITLNNIVLCSFRAALRVNIAKRSDPIIMQRPWNKPNTPYTARYMFLLDSDVVARGSSVHLDSQMFPDTWKP